MQFRTLDTITSSTLNRLPFRFIDMANGEGETEFQARINRVISELSERGINQVQLAKSADVSRAMVTHWRKGGVQKMSGAQAIAICRHYGYSPVWLMTGEGPVMMPAGAGVGAAFPWPFPGIDEEKVARLPAPNIHRLEGAMVTAAEHFGFDIVNLAA